MTRRAGMSLTEVLVALFIMALGTIAILTLFPLGAIQMGQALRDDRTAQAATQADSYMRTYWKQNIYEPGVGVTTSTSFDSNLVLAFSNPSQAAMNALFPTASPQPPPFQPNLLPVSSGPSYPVVIDPMGVFARQSSTTNQFWVFGPNLNPNFPPIVPGTNLVRMNLATIQATGQLQAFRSCSLMDGLGYNTFGLAVPQGTQMTPPAPGQGSPVDRETRYNWLWVLQQPTISQGITTSTTANMVVVVFDKRTNLFAPSTAEQFYAPVACNPGSTLVSFPRPLNGILPGNPPVAPPVQKGDWLLDATVTHIDCVGNIYVPATPPPVPVPPKPPATFIFQSPQSLVRNANFYRVVSITDNPTNNTMDIELQTPMKPDSVDPAVTANLPQTISPIPLPTQRQFVLMTGVADVFDRAPIVYP